MTDCTEYAYLLSEQLDGAISPQEETQLTAHLATCPACRRLARELSALHTELDGMIPVPPASLGQAVMAQVQAEAGTVPLTEPKPTARRRRSWYGVAAAVLAVVICGGAFLAASPFGMGGEAAETAAVAEEDTPAEENAEKESAQEESLPESLAPKPSSESAVAGGADTQAILDASPSAKEEAVSADSAVPSSGGTAEASADTDTPPTDMANENTACTALTETQAKELLTDSLARQGGSWLVTPRGQSETGGEWLFTAEEKNGGETRAFSVSADDGAVTELPPAE